MTEEEMTIEELNEEENEDEEERLDLEALGYDDESLIQKECYGEIARTVTEIAQPIKTIVDVGAREYANGKVKPFCKFSIERNLTDDVDEFEVIKNDFEELIKEVRKVFEASNNNWGIKRK